ncbi:AAA family ATPase [Moraxella bovoculi]|uniref:AAA family ATPase n=1 Tax=Moraxella bovoculi TaxID=386891 RepID=UPI003F4FCDDE
MTVNITRQSDFRELNFDSRILHDVFINDVDYSQGEAIPLLDKLLNHAGYYFGKGDNYFSLGAGEYQGRATGKNIILTDDNDTFRRMYDMGADVVFGHDINDLALTATERKKNIRIITDGDLRRTYENRRISEPSSLDGLFDDGSKVSLLRASDVTAKPISWIWEGWLPLGKLTVFAGAAGSGKTTIAMDLIRAVTTGGKLPDNKQCKVKGECLIYSTEDDIADTLTPRLQATGADLTKVHFIDGVIEDGEKRHFEATEDIPRLFKAIQGRNIKLIVIDPILSAVSGDMNKATDVRTSLKTLVDFAENIGCAVIGITHFAKGTKGQDPTERILGSQAFTALARMNWVTAPSQEPDQPNVFAKAKTNIAKADGGFNYFIEPCQVHNIDTTRIKWGEFKQGTTKELLREIESSGEEKEMSSADYAQQFLLDILHNCDEMKVTDIQREGKDAGFSQDQLRRAKDKICTTHRKSDGWYWSLKSAYQSTEPSCFIDLKN